MTENEIGKSQVDWNETRVPSELWRGINERRDFANAEWKSRIGLCALVSLCENEGHSPLGKGGKAVADRQGVVPLANKPGSSIVGENDK